MTSAIYADLYQCLLMYRCGTVMLPENIASVLFHDNFRKIASLVEVYLPVDVCGERFEMYQELWNSVRKCTLPPQAPGAGWQQYIDNERLSEADQIVRNRRSARASRYLPKAAVRTSDGSIVSLPEALTGVVLKLI